MPGVAGVIYCADVAQPVEGQPGLVLQEGKDIANSGFRADDRRFAARFGNFEYLVRESIFERSSNWVPNLFGRFFSRLRLDRFGTFFGQQAPTSATTWVGFSR